MKAIDASLRGFGVLESTWTLEACAAMGRWKEHARFRGINASAEDPRERALEKAIAGMSPTDAHACAAEAGFPEVLARDLFQATWRVTTSRRWKRRSRRILELEGSAGLVCAALGAACSIT